MEYRFLGRTGIRVSALCFGTMSFGDIADESTSAAMFKACREAGINFFDCADKYSGGRAEEILGRLLKDCRDEMVIVSKVGNPMGEGINDRGHSRRHILRACEMSLKRLGTDRLDLYFLHLFDPHTPMEETLAALDQLVREGKVLYTGVSNWAAWQAAKALGLTRLKGLAPIHCIQPMYNLAKRQAEVELLPLAREEGLGVITYSPLGGGLLTGKYIQAEPDQGRFIVNEKYRRRYAAESNVRTASNLDRFARERGFDPATLAVSWVMSHPAVTAPIVGARNLDQLKSSLAAAEFKMDPKLRQEISDLSPAPPLATDRDEERG
jgi:aryl-alcohol dehydrogenase-like predicted oxidoreductase